jgi:hypothetical protein
MDADVLELFIPLAGIVFGSLMFLIPIAAFSIRFAIKPVMEAIRASREAHMGGTGRELSVLEQRVALLEQHYQNLESSVDRLTDIKDFERRLTSPEPTESQPLR